LPGTGIAELITLQKLHPVKQFMASADVYLATPSLMDLKCAPSGLEKERGRGERESERKREAERK
jgi:hypothetical protein